MFCGISGPLATGKSTLIHSISKDLPIDAVVIKDLHSTVYDELLATEIFTTFHEISKDRDYLLMYYGRIINYYVEMVEAYREYPGLVVIDGTHIDILIYGMLSLWYHYPTAGLQEKLISKLIGLQDIFSVIYMTVADDDNYKLDNLGRRRYVTSFLKNRPLELYYYDIFRRLPQVVTLPSSSVSDCNEFVIEDLKKKSLM